jgi:cell division protein FtsW (lipid II flippase)
MASIAFGQGNIRTAGAPAPEYDRSLAWAALLLVSMGLVMVYSASISTAEASRYAGHNAAYFLLRHGFFLALALAAATAVFLVPIRYWQKGAPWLFAGAFVLLVLVLIPGIGREVNGARRWLNLGIGTLQPSELMKLAVVLYAADYTVRKHAVLKQFKRGLLPLLAVMLVVAWLLLREPDFGALVVIAVTSFGILFVWRHERPAFHGAGWHARCGIRRAGAVFALSHAAHLRLHGSLVGSLRARLPAVARADRLRPRRVAGRRPGRGASRSCTTCLRRTPISCSR